MSRIFLALAFALMAAVGLSSCGTKVRLTKAENQIYDVRRAVVTADAGVPASVISGVQRRVDMAIDMTHRPVQMPRVVMNIHINSVTKGLGLDKGQSEAQVRVTLADASEGQPFLAATMPVYSYTQQSRTANEALAEAIAAKIRFTYALKVPPVRPAAYRKPAIATVMSTEDVPPGPLVIPADTAPVVGANADPVLNSKTDMQAEKPAAKVEPALDAAAAAKPATEEAQPAAIDEGASAAVKIEPKADQPAEALDTKAETPGSDEPCVETVETKCAN